MKTLFIEPGSPWENGYFESFNRQLRDELLNGEIFATLREAQVLIESWRRHYTPSGHTPRSATVRPARGHLAAGPWPALRYAPVSPRAGQSGRTVTHGLVSIRGQARMALNPCFPTKGRRHPCSWSRPSTAHDALASIGQSSRTEHRPLEEFGPQRTFSSTSIRHYLQRRIRIRKNQPLTGNSINSIGLKQMQSILKDCPLSGATRTSRRQAAMSPDDFVRLEGLGCAASGFNDHPRDHMKSASGLLWVGHERRDVNNVSLIQVYWLRLSSSAPPRSAPGDDRRKYHFSRSDRPGLPVGPDAGRGSPSPPQAGCARPRCPAARQGALQRAEAAQTWACAGRAWMPAKC